ncbi:hypothetical protein [Agrococcus baldri]|uniref:hypothetical protein n=1 Tax=Agrococcus baldri TaxID=153730 RepID=UPI0015A7153A|nr:hypothetical protein [Agrococcus baldri]
MPDIFDELDFRCPKCNVLVYDERCRGCGYVIEALRIPEVESKRVAGHDDVPGIGGW